MRPLILSSVGTGRRGKAGGYGLRWGWGQGGEGRVSLRDTVTTDRNSVHSCTSTKMGSDESHFNVSVGSDGQTESQLRQCPQTTTFLKGKES